MARKNSRARKYIRANAGKGRKLSVLQAYDLQRRMIEGDISSHKRYIVMYQRLSRGSTKSARSARKVIVMLRRGIARREAQRREYGRLIAEEKRKQSAKRRA